VLLRRSLAIILVLASFLAIGFAADGANNKVFTVTVVSPTLVKDVQVRYFLGGEFGFVNSTSTATGIEDKIVINTEHESKAATSLKAIAFAPGCQFVTFSVDDLSTSNRQGEFQCQKLPTTLLQGRVALSGMEGKDLQVQVLYVCNWAGQFFNIGPSAVSPFALAKTSVATDGTFSLELPDFSSDPLWSSLSKDALLSFHLIDAATGHPLNALVPPASLSHGSLLKVTTSYPGETLFAVQGPEAAQR
jgi:hypothetical protein